MAEHDLGFIRPMVPGILRKFHLLPPFFCPLFLQLLLPGLLRFPLLDRIFLLPFFQNGKQLLLLQVLQMMLFGNQLEALLLLRRP